jgi:hypothetical protein
MIIVPYIHTSYYSKHTNKTIHKVKILCQGGSQLWIEDDVIEKNIDDYLINNILSENGLFCINNKFHRVGLNTFLCPIDTKKTDMSIMYNWHELEMEDNETLSWCTYIVITNPNETGETLFWLKSPSIHKDFNYIIENIVLYKTESV